MQVMILCALIVLSSCMPYGYFLMIKKECTNKFLLLDKINRCEYDPTPAGSFDPCSLDYYKSQVCEAHWSDCTDLSLNTTTLEYPYVCWACWVHSDTTTDVYRKFQNCMRDVSRASLLNWSLPIILGITLLLGL